MAIRACTAALLLGTPARGKCNTGPVGSCVASECLPTVGPTDCVSGQCMCKSGFCWATLDETGHDDSLMRCRALVGTCNILDCGSSHGGPHAAECIDGMCLCHPGFHADEDSVCQRGWWPPPLLMAVNGTEGLATARAGRRRPRQAAAEATAKPAWPLMLLLGPGFTAACALAFGLALLVAAAQALRGAQQGGTAASLGAAPEGGARYERLPSAPAPRSARA